MIKKQATSIGDQLFKFKETLIKEGSGGKPEGFVIKFEPILLNKYGERLIFKVKFKDFKTVKSINDYIAKNIKIDKNDS